MVDPSLLAVLNAAFLSKCSFSPADVRQVFWHQGYSQGDDENLDPPSINVTERSRSWSGDI